MNAIRKERGATAIVVAISLLMLLGFTALAIDGGMGLNDRRGTQNAADAAALAAAWESCNPSGVGPEAAGIAKAAENGYTHDPSGYPQITISGTGDTRTATIVERNDAWFGRATPYAPDQIDVQSTATARCFDQGVLGGYALFAETPACGGNNDLKVTGGTTVITGGVHSNDDVLVTGSSPVVNGEFTFRDNSNVNPPAVATQYFGSPKPYPLELTIEEYEPGPPAGTRATSAGADYHDLSGGNITLSTLEPLYGITSGSEFILSTAGIYYTDRAININSKTLVLTGDAATRGVTFVAGDSISVGSAENLRGYDPLFTSSGPRLLFFANDNDPSPRCNPAALSISGNDVEWEGVMFAPFGLATISAAGNSTINGSILAWAVDLAGGDISVTYQGDPNADPNWRVELID